MAIRDGLMATSVGRISAVNSVSADSEIRERAAGEPLIWLGAPWRDGNKEYSGQIEVFVEGVLWRELDAILPIN